MEKEKKVEKELDTIVVRDLPTQKVNRYMEEDKEIRLLTVEEALTELLNRVSRIEKSLG